MLIIRREHAYCLLNNGAKLTRFDQLRGNGNEKLVAHNTILQGLVTPPSSDDDHLVADDPSYRLIIVPWQGIGNNATGFAAY